MDIVNYDEFTNDKYLKSLLESANPQLSWFLREDVSEEEILREAELLVEKLDIKKADKFVKDKMKFVEKTLKEYGVSPEQLKMSGKKVAKKFTGYHEKGLTPPQAAKEIQNDITKTAKTALAKIVKNPTFGMKAQDAGKKVLVSLAAFVVIMIVGGMIAGISAIPFMVAGAAPALWHVFNAVVVAPFLEEAVKTWFIQKGMPWTGTGVVFGIEAVMYIFSIMMAGGSLPAALLIRAVALLMHFLTTAVQKVIIDKKKDRGYDIMPGTDKTMVFTAWAAGVLIHATWNSMALLYSKDFNRLLGI